jgi:hypothetical protein
LVEIKGEKKVRLEEIWKLHKEGKSTREITDWMNGKYQTTLRSKKPYYPSLVYETIKKYRKRLERLNNHFHSYEYVDFVRIEEVLKWERPPGNLCNRNYWS